MAKRRANNEGTIFKDTRGLWIAEVVLPDGKKKRKASKRQSVVKEWLQTTLNQLKADVYIEDDKLTVSQFFDRFMSDVGAVTLRPKTIDSYKSTIEKHIKPDLGGIALKNLKPSHLQALYSKKLESGLSKRSVQYIHSILRRGLNQAVKWEMLIRNPANSVVAPKPDKKPPETLSVGEIQKFFDVAKDHRYFPIYAIAVGCGLREGEILGLRKKDVSLAEGVLKVEQTVVSIRGKISLGEPKSDASKRFVAMPAFVAASLVEPLAAVSEGDQLIFTTSTGRPISPRNLLRQFHISLEKAGIHRVKFHSLRHTFVSYLLSKNTPAKDVQVIAGHSHFSTTVDIYGHAMPGALQEAAKKMDGIFEV